MRRIDDRTAASEVAGPEGHDERADALVLADDVPHAAREGRVLRGEALDIAERRVAQGHDAEAPGGVIALCAPLVVRALLRVVVRDAGVDDRDLDAAGDRHALDLRLAHVDEQRLADAREARGELVHRADARSDDVAFRLVRGVRERRVVEREGERVTQRAQQRDLERGA